MKLRIQDLVVGHDDIDAQHETILRRFADVQQTIDAGDSAALGAALARVWDVMVGHFATEDALMEEFAYPERVAHRAAHQLFLEDLRALVREREAQGLSEEVVAWSLERLPEWLAFHIQTNDAPFARFVVRKTARDMNATALGDARTDRRPNDS